MPAVVGALEPTQSEPTVEMLMREPVIRERLYSAMPTFRRMLICDQSVSKTWAKLEHNGGEGEPTGAKSEEDRTVAAT